MPKVSHYSLHSPAWDCLMGDCDLCWVHNMAIICHVQEERSSNAMVKWNFFFMGHIITKSKEEKKFETYLQMFFLVN